MLNSFEYSYMANSFLNDYKFINCGSFAYQLYSFNLNIAIASVYYKLQKKKKQAIWQ